MKKHIAMLTGLVLLLSPAGMLPLPAAAEGTYADTVPDRVTLGEDGVYYAATPYALGVLDDIVPNPGEVMSCYELEWLLAAHPDGTFAVDVISYAWADADGYFSDTLAEFNATHTVGDMTYAAFWEAWYAADKAHDQETLDALEGYLPEIQDATNDYCAQLRTQFYAEEREQFVQNGYEMIDSANHDCYGQYCLLLTGEQLRSFTGHERCGYLLGLAPMPAQTATNLPEGEEAVTGSCGDANDDGDIDIMDVIYINHYLVGGITFTEAQKYSADCDKNGVIDSTDSLHLLKFVVGLLDSFDSLG